MNFKILYIAFFFLLSTSLFAEVKSTNLQFLYIDKDSCTLKEMFSYGKPDVAKGKRTLFNKCEIPIKKEEFEKKYSFCALSGITIYNKGKSHSCNLLMLNIGYTFYQSEGVDCKFVCYKK